jgi:L-threonylcarbamoyladenylate synthase
MLFQEEEVPPATTDNTKKQVVAQFTSDVSACLDRLQNGGLVAVPTETVYGLAANVRNESALQSIFIAKERPHSDPLIVHVDGYETAIRDFWNANPVETIILHQLAKLFWPGPLTMVCTAHPTVSSLVTAGTGMVAVRHPNLISIDSKLLPLLSIPFAAPSANKFGHVSPTTAQHVMDDLQYEDVWILTTTTKSSSSSNNSDTAGGNGNNGCCAIGVESTVVQVVEDTVSILRPGQVTYEQLVKALLPLSVTVRYNNNNSNKPLTEPLPLPTQQHHHPVDIAADDDDEDSTQQQQRQQQQPAHVSPGQLLQHYSPLIPSYLIPINHPNDNDDQNNKNDASGDSCLPDLRVLRHAVVLDMYDHLRSYQKDCLAYRNLGGTAPEIARNLFASLRWAENQPDAQFVFFPQLLLLESPSSSSSTPFLSLPSSLSVDNNNHNITQLDHHRDDSILAAVADRLHRAASGRVLTNMADLLPLLLLPVSVEEEVHQEAVLVAPPLPATAS